MTTPRRPNIVLCLCDQLRAFEVGCYGNTAIRTPNIDRLAAQGIRFETAISNAPVCMAARSVTLSGQYNRTCTGGVANVCHEVRPGFLNMPEWPAAGRPHLKDQTLPETLRAHGYYNAAIGKWHVHSWPTDIGFDSYLIPRVHHCHSGQSFMENGGPEFTPPGWSVDFEAQRVEQFLNARKESGSPFFLYYNISPPHCPLADAPAEYLTMYAPEDIPIRPNVDLRTPLPDQDHWFKIYRYDFRYYNLHLPHTEELPAGYDLRRLLAEYYGLTTWMDAALGKMLAALEAAGLAENTVVIFTSDHGDNLGSHGLVQKWTPNEEAIRVPLIVRWPAMIDRPGFVRGQVVSLVDIAPTITDLVGVPMPEPMRGRSFAPLLRRETRMPPRNWAFVETGDGIGIRTPAHLYFCGNNRGSRGIQPAPAYFYDLAADPYQMDNLAGTDRQAGVAEELRLRLTRWHETTPWIHT